MLSTLAISYRYPADEADFTELRELLAAGRQSIAIERRDQDGPQAGLEWLIPTAVILFIGKAYLDGFVKEIGKEHYILLKQGLKTLYARLVGPTAPEITIVSTAGKITGGNQYSMLFSLLAEAPDGLCFKLLIRSRASEAEYESTVNAFIAFLDAFNAGQLSAEQIAELRTSQVVGRTLLLVYDPTKDRVTPVDPLSPKR